MKLRPHHWVVLSAWAGKVVTAVIQIAVIRVIIDRVGIDLYAGLALLTGLAGWYALADGGIGNSLQNHIAERRATGESSDGLVWTGLLLAFLLLLALMVLQQLISPVLGPLLLKNIPGLDDEARSASFRIFGQISLLAVAAGLVYKIWYAVQKGYLANVLPALAAVIGYVAVKQVPVGTSADQLAWCLVAIVAPTALLPLPFALGHGLQAWRRGARITRGQVRLLMGRASQFTGLALMAAVVLQVDYIVLSQVLPASGIVVYNVSMKVFSTAFFVYFSVLLAFWPVLTELIAKGDWPAVRARVKSILGRGACFMLAVTIGVLLFERQIFDLLAPRSALSAGPVVIVLLGLYFSVRIWTDTFSTVLSSMSHVGPLLRWVPVQATVNIALQIILAPRYGVAGMVVALISAFLLTVSWVLPRHVVLMWSSR